MTRARPLLPNLTVTQLEYLDAVTRHDTWAEAADSLGVTPSALSQGIAELERRIGLALFQRDGRRRVLRDQAVPVAAHARRVVTQTRDLSRWVGGVRAGVAGPLRVGMIDVAAVVHLTATLRAFRRDRPGLDLRLTVAPSAALLDQLDEGDLDVVVCVRPPGGDDPAWRLITLLEEPIGVYAPEGARSEEPSRWGPWVTFPEGSHSRSLVARALVVAGAPFAVVAESHQPDVLAEMVRLGMGYTALPTSQAEGSPRPLRPVRPEPLAFRELVAVRRTDALDHPAADALVDAFVGWAVTKGSG